LVDKELPSAASLIADGYPELWRAFTALGKASADAGPLDGATLRLVKLALAIGAGLEGAVHSHSRQALQEGIEPAALEHVALLAVPTLGFAASLRALTWIRDITPE
jgi:alkylhydroperoxidase/carboxymuconolactone decarboxylase family protein YurZ